MAPDLRRKVDATRAARLARETEMKKQADAQVRFFLVLSCGYQKTPLLCSFFGVIFVSLIETINLWFRDLRPF